MAKRYCQKRLASCPEYFGICKSGSFSKVRLQQSMIVLLKEVAAIIHLQGIVVGMHVEGLHGGKVAKSELIYLFVRGSIHRLARLDSPQSAGSVDKISRGI